MQHAFTPNVLFGLNPMWVSTILLVCVYAAIIWDQINRAIIALLGIAVMIFSGILTQEEAMRGVDVNTIGLLTGMMILVSISRRSGMFQYVAIRANPSCSVGFSRFAAIRSRTNSGTIRARPALRSLQTDKGTSQ